MARLLKGKEVNENLNEIIKLDVEKLKKKEIYPTLAIVRLGEDKSQISYETGATKRCLSLGVNVNNVVLKEDATQALLLDVITRINNDDSVHGVLILRPLPAHINDEAVRNALSVKKDVDGITDLSIGGMIFGSDSGFPPCTPKACLSILDHYNIPLKGKNVAMIGASLVVGRPMAMMLLQRDATVFICHEFTKDVPKICQNADIIIVAVGKAGLITKSHLKSGQVVLDVGINVNQEGKLCGDVDFAAATEIVEAITPVPRGVGTVTTSILVRHTVNAALKQLQEQGNAS